MPDPADPSVAVIFGRAVAVNYRWKNVERSKPSIKEEANKALRRPLDFPRFLCRVASFGGWPGLSEPLTQQTAVVADGPPFGGSVLADIIPAEDAPSFLSLLCERWAA